MSKKKNGQSPKTTPAVEDQNVSRELESSLEQAASEWSPDEARASTSLSANAANADGEKPKAAEGGLNPEGGNDYVSFIDEPFGIRTIEISEAQQNSEELDLDSELSGDEIGEASTPGDDAELGPDPQFAPPEASDAQLENLARSIEEQNRELEKQAAVNEAENAEKQAEELARQIAEDEALAAQMAQEALEAEKNLETDPELLAALPKQPTPDEQGKLDLQELESCVETMLFMMDRPVSAKRLKEWLGPDFEDGLFEQALAGLQARYQSPGHGIDLVEVSGGWQLRTKPGRAALAKKLAKIQTQRLSTGGMESLAIVAYRQPVMKEEIDKIRGVDSSYFIRGLLDKKLIAISGRSELPGRPMLYATTEHFLELFGLKDLSSLPSLRELEQMVPASQSKNPADEDPRIKEMRRLVDKMKMDTSTTLLYDPKEDEALLTEIRERVKAIPTSTPYLDEQKALEKAAKEAALNPQQPAENLFEAVTGLPPEGVPLHPEMADVPVPESMNEPEPTTDQP